MIFLGYIEQSSAHDLFFENILQNNFDSFHFLMFISIIFYLQMKVLDETKRQLTFEMRS